MKTNKKHYIHFRKLNDISDYYTILCAYDILDCIQELKDYLNNTFKVEIPNKDNILDLFIILGINVYED